MVTPFPNSAPRAPLSDLTALGDGMLFTSDDGVHRDELWKSDGTDAGTGLLADIYPGNGSSKPENLIELNGVLFFSATRPDGRRTLWISDGSSNGTLPVRDDASAPLNSSELAGWLPCSAVTQPAQADPGAIM